MRSVVYFIYIVGTAFVLFFLSLIVTNRLGLPTFAIALIQIAVIACGGVFGYLQAKKNEGIREAKKAARARSQTDSSE
jgi:ABC-type bacteriocin/lantibiotic exporter with double-glycine peptidase domain